MTVQAPTPTPSANGQVDGKSTAVRNPSSSTRKRTSHSHSASRRSKQPYPTSGPATPAIVIIILLAALIALAILAILIGPELYAFYKSQASQSQSSSFTAAFATFLSLRQQERTSQNVYAKHLLTLRSALLNSTWAHGIHAQWANSMLASIPPTFTPPGLQLPAYRHLTVTEHILLLIVSPHTHLPWPLSVLPGLFRLAAALAFSPIVLIGVADFAGYAVFRTLGLQRRRVRIKRAESPEREQGQGDDYINAKLNGTDRARPVPFPRPNSGATSPRPGEAGGAPLLAPGTYDAEVLLRHRARSRSTSGTESADAEAEWARTGGQFARVSAVREAAKRSSQEARAQGVPPLTIPVAANNGEGGAHEVESSPALTHASLVSPPASPRTRFFRLRLPGVIGQEGALGMSDLTDFEDSGPESGTSSPVHSFSRASSVSSGYGAASVRTRHRPRIGAFTPLATPNEDDGSLKSLAITSSGRPQPPAFMASGAVASAHPSDGDSDDAGDESNIKSSSLSSLQPQNATMHRSKTRMPASQSDLPPSAPTSPSVRRSQLPDPNVLSRTLRSLAGLAKSALTPGPMDPDAARLTEEGTDTGLTLDGLKQDASGSLGDDDNGNSLGLDAGEPRVRAESRPRRTSLFGDEEINYTYSGAGLVSGLRSADLGV